MLGWKGNVYKEPEICLSNTRGQSRTVKQWVQRSYGDWLIGVRGQMCVDQY